MPASYLVDPARRMVFFRLWGVVTEDDLLGIDSDARSDPRVSDGFNRLVDLSGVSEVPISSAGIRTIAEVARQAPVARRAFVAPATLMFGLARMFELNLRLPDTSSSVFHDLPSAMVFLGLDPGTPWPEGPPDGVRGADAEAVEERSPRSDVTG